MSLFPWLRRMMRSPHHAPPANRPPDDGRHARTLDERAGWLERKLSRCDDVIFHEVKPECGERCLFVYLKGMSDVDFFQSHVLEPLVQSDFAASGEELARKVVDLKLLPVSSLHTVTKLPEALSAIMEGQIVLLLESDSRIVIFPLASYEKRPVFEPNNEAVIRGPREAFIEDMETNLTMVRRKIRHHGLKVEKMQFGRYSNTAIAIVYLEDVCKMPLIDEVKKRLSRLDIDSVLDSNTIEEYIEDNPFSPFPQVQYTERPDTLASALLEGRFAIFVDGTPIPLIAPVTFYMLMQSAEDYYQRFIASTWIRWIRYLFLFVSLLFPSIYIAIITFHPEMLPPSLLTTVAAARDIVPFPAIVEAMIMEISFEALREAGVRVPKPIGQTISIVGGLIIGQAAVQAGIVSAPMVIIVSITGIASFIIPHYDLGLAQRLLRFPIMILAASFGLFGIIIGFLLVYIHLLTLRSFGLPYLASTAPMRFSDLKDIFIRAPWWMMRKRPAFYWNRATSRETKVSRPEVPHEEDGD